MNQPVSEPRETAPDTGLPSVFEANLAARHVQSRLWRSVFRWSTVVGIVFLALLLYNISNQSIGYVAIGQRVDPGSLAMNGVAIEALDQQTLTEILKANISSGLLRQLERERPLSEYSRDEIYALVIEKVVQPEVLQTWTLTDSILHASQIRAEAAQAYPQAELHFRSWITPKFLKVPQSANPLVAGVRTALLGSLWTIAITILVAFPVGVGAAIYLEEYAVQNRLTRLIQTNINNLAGVPSIIYGMLGLAIFVRTLEPVTSGSAFGLTDPTTANGRTILSAGLTLALLVLPLIIINGQEAIRAVSASLRQASYGVGATKWQTVWHHVLPSAMLGILTGTILAISRAIGETAPLVVIGAATYITFDPSGPFSKFTTLPIQIYQWTSRPQAEFRNLAAAAIITLLAMLLSLNALAIVLRNYFRRAGGNS
jgi:phosphate transport system permease protein